DLLMVSREVRREAWTTPFLESLPAFFNLCPEGAAEATNEAWRLEGTLNDPLDREALVLAWDRVRPARIPAQLERLTLTAPVASQPAQPVAIRAVPIAVAAVSTKSLEPDLGSLQEQLDRCNV